MENQELIEKEASSVVEQAKSVVVTTQEELQKATEFTKNVKQAIKKVEEFFEPMKTQAHATWKGICDKQNEIIKPLKEAEIELKKTMTNFMDKLEKERIDRENALRKQQEEDRKKALENASTESDINDVIQQETIDNSIVVEAEKPKVEGMSTVKEYKITVLDDSKVPAYINGICIRDVNLTAIKKIAQMSNGSLDIPGIKIEVTTGIRIKS